MKYTQSEIEQYVVEEDVKFIRLAFVDIFGKQKNISIMPSELRHAFDYGIAIDSSAIPGFEGEIKSDLLLHPDSSTLSILPWRPDRGRVVRMYCTLTHPDGSPFDGDTRRLLCDAVEEARQMGVSFHFGPELEFYLFQRDEHGTPTRFPLDQAGYMDVSPDDKGENIRREVCLTLERMGICPESSHHEEGPGQNEIDFRYSDPLDAADDTITFRFVVNTIAAVNGLYADFSPRPLKDFPGNGMHINVSAQKEGTKDLLPYIISGLLKRIYETSVFFNTTEDSYKRLGRHKAPKYISWSHENRSQLLRIPAATGNLKRVELRSPDPLCNPYLAFAFVIWSTLEALNEGEDLVPPCDLNLSSLDDHNVGLRTLPLDLHEACEAAMKSHFVRSKLPDFLLDHYIKRILD